jgi:hypothetical protein
MQQLGEIGRIEGLLPRLPYLPHPYSFPSTLSPIYPKSLNIVKSGEVAEWSIALDLKSSVPQGTVGSNPTLSVDY